MQHLRTIFSITLATAMTWLASAGQAVACSVCVSSAMSEEQRNAYYLITVLLTGVVLAILFGFYFVVYRGYILPARNQQDVKAQ